MGFLNRTMAEQLAYRGTLKGHENWVTAIATSLENDRMVVSASRDKSIIIWELKRDDEENYGFARRALKGHGHFVQDVVLSSDGQFALSASWDATMRLWDLNTGTTTRRFVGHSKDVLSVAFSADNRQIVSGSRDKTIKLWNTLGECKYTIQEAESHTEWVSCVRFSPGPSPTPVTVSPDGSLCASGGKDGTAMLWDLQEGRHLYSLDAGDVIYSLIFSPNRYWLCAGTQNKIKVWDLESKSVVDELCPEFPPVGKKAMLPYCLSLCWSGDGQTLFAGYTDGVVRVWAVHAN